MPNTMNTKKEISEKEKRSRIVIGIIAGVATLAVIILFIALFSNKKSTSCAYTIYLEGEAGYCLEVDENLNVIQVTQQGTISFAPDYDSFVGQELEDTLISLVGNLRDNEIITKKKNVVLISVGGGAVLENLQLVVDLIPAVYLADTDTLDLAIVGQVIEDVDATLQSIENTTLTIGKKVLIDRILYQNTFLLQSDIENLSLEDLVVLGHVAVSNINYVYQAGYVYTSDYVTKASVQTISIADSGLEAEQMTNARIDLTGVFGKLAYEFDFDCDGYSYEYYIDAKTGDVLNKITFAIPSSDGYVSMETAQNTAVTGVGLESDDVTELDAVLCHEHSTMVYAVSFEYSSYIYELLVDAETGKIVKLAKKSE